MLTLFEKVISMFGNPILIEKWIASHLTIINIGFITVISLLSFIILYSHSMEILQAESLNMMKQLSGKAVTAMKSKKRGLFSFEQQKIRLDTLGVTYRSKGRFTPLVYILVKFSFIIIGLILCIELNIFLGILVAVGCWFGIDLYFKFKNKADNKEMLSSLIDIYFVIILQVSAGIPINRILVDAYWTVKHPRLKSALLTLTGDVAYTGNLEQSVETFGRKFENESIKQFVVLIKQLAEIGSSVNMLNDIKKSLNILRASYNGQAKKQSEDFGDTVLILIFIGIIVLIVYTSFTSFVVDSSLFS